MRSIQLPAEGLAHDRKVESQPLDVSVPSLCVSMPTLITNPMCPTFPTEVSEAQRQPLAAALALPFPTETSHNEHALCPAGSRSVL